MTRRRKRLSPELFWSLFVVACYAVGISALLWMPGCRCTFYNASPPLLICR